MSGGIFPMGVPDYCCEVEPETVIDKLVAEKERDKKALKKEADPTNPSYYTKQPIEPIAIIEAYDMGFHLGNVLKYLLRWKDKHENGIVDLKKAKWYLDRFIELEEEKQKGK